MGDMEDMYHHYIPNGDDYHNQEEPTMTRAAGTVQYVNEKPTKFGYTTWNFRLDGDDKYYGTYKTFPGVAQGDIVAFEYSTNAAGFHDVAMKSIQKEAAATVESTGASRPVSSPAPTAETHRAAATGKSHSIVWQHSQEMALRLVAVAADADCLDLGTKGGKAGKFEALGILVNQATVDYYEAATLAEINAGNPFEPTE